MTGGGSRLGDDDGATDSGRGMSRRGWMLLVGIVAAVLVVPLALAVVSAVTAFGRGGAKHASPSAAPPVAGMPERQAVPTPVGAPPRPTHTQVATVPAQPVATLPIGACLQVFETPWADGYPVVDCSTPHIAQVLTRGRLPEGAGTLFPGTSALEKQVTDLCSAPGLLNWDWVAVWNEDVQVELRYPNTAARWSAGDRAYDCFVDTLSKHELTGDALAHG